MEATNRNIVAEWCGERLPRHRRVAASAKRVSANHQITKSPNPQIPCPSPLAPRPSGFTLIEMLIVIGIMLLLVGAAATMMQPASESRRIREAARSINIYLSTARSRAMELGRPCGVTFRFLGQKPIVLNADQCEVPAKYSGQTDQSMARVTGGTVTLVSGTASETIPEKMVKLNDLVQFDYHGVIYSITATVSGSGSVDSNGYLSGASAFTISVFSPQPAPLLPTYSQPVPYSIFRSPTKGGATPLQLPARSIIDAWYSGVGTDPGGTNLYFGKPWDALKLLPPYEVGSTVERNGLLYVCIQTSAGNDPATSPLYWQVMTDFTILFAPSGAVQSVYCGSVSQPLSDTIYLLIGKPGSETTNWQDMQNVWVTINLQTGAVATEQMAPSAAGGAAGIAAARGFAVQGQGMGGR
jgi:prepilin-type N-terminal cleavage/methylation domain-containing protein